jgi:uncharacterized protein YecE (DUF72 family)
MEFGKVPNTLGIDFTLPPDHPATARRLAPGRSSASRGSDPRIFAGCPVWQDDAMAKKLCPKGTPKSKRLAAYSLQFNSLELNSTGYGLNPDQVLQWAAATPVGFRFCPKVSREISLVPNLDYVHGHFARHLEDAALFGDRLGHVLLQFPESSGPDRFPQLERLLSAPRPGLPLALEVRHPAWFHGRDWMDRLFGLMEEQGIVSVITDTPGRRDVIHQRLASPSVFIRLNGHSGTAEDIRRIEAWAERVRRWLDLGLRDVYFFPHIDPVDRTVEMAAHFIKSLKARTGLDLREPRLQEELEEPRLAL